MSMTLDEFQEKCIPGKPLDYNELGALGVTLFWSNGMGGEAGEAQNFVKKMVRDGVNNELAFGLLAECGDTLFYMKMLLERYGFTMDDAARQCIAKLELLAEEQDER